MATQGASYFNASHTRAKSGNSVTRSRGNPADETLRQSRDQENATNLTQTKNLLTKRRTKPAYLQSLNEQEKAENFKIIDSMNKKISFKTNPRFKEIKAPIKMTEAGKDQITDKNNPFRVEPPVVLFVDYQVKGVYEIPIKVTNSSGLIRRIKFVPPASQEFTVCKVKYPKGDTGDIAPGMSLTMVVAFQAPSFADFDDFITFVTERNSFQVPIRARRDPPLITLQNPMNTLDCWVGDRTDMVFRCHNQGGDGGFKFFCERDEDDQNQPDPEQIYIGPFVLHPSEFYIYSGKAIDIYVSFTPNQEGQKSENLILACDNQTSEYYQLTGSGTMLDIDVVGIDTREVDFKKNPFSTIQFENTNPTSESRRTIRIKNESPILVPFHWSVYKNKNLNKISLQDEQTHYRIEPSQGRIPGGEVMEFEIFFSPDHAEPYFEYADLIVEDIPIQAVRNPPEGLKNFAEQAANYQKQSRVPMPTYVGSNTQFLSIPVLQFNLKGQGNSCKVICEPPTTFLDGDRFINTTYTETIKLLKKSEGAVKYKIRLEGKSSSLFDIDLRVGGQSISLNEVIQGQIPANSPGLDMQLVVRSEECGPMNAFFYIEIEDGPPATFQCLANFRGPIVIMDNPIIDFGLTRIYSKQQYSLQLSNTSPVPAEIILKNSRNKKVSWETGLDIGNNKDSSGHRGSIVQPGKGKTLGSNPFDISPFIARIEPNSKIDVMVTLDTQKTEVVDEHFEVLVKDSEDLYFQMLADIQKPQVCLSRTQIELGRIYAGVKETVETNTRQAIVLKNYGNIPAVFHWEEKMDPERVIARFEPSRGTIPPKSEVAIHFSVTVYYGGNINELFICNIQDVELPIGFEMKADSFGLSVSYESTDDSQAKLNLTQSSMGGGDNITELGQSVMSAGGLQKTQLNSSGAQPVKVANPSNKLKILDFPACMINKPSTTKFVIKNQSGIKTQFKFSTLYFEPISHQAPQHKSEIEKAREALAQEDATSVASQSVMGSPAKSPPKGGKQIRFAPSAKSGGSKFMGSGFKKAEEKKWNRPILSDEHEQTNKFSSATGETFTQTRRLEREMAFFLSNNKGIAVIFSPNVGELPPHSEIPVTVTVYNNVCGRFDDKFISEVKGLPNIEFPVSIQISGSPVEIPPNQVGINYNSFPPALPMPTIVHNSAPISKTFTIKNTGIREVVIDWKIYDERDIYNVERDYFTLDVVKNLSYDRQINPYKFHLEEVRPPESENTPYSIEPQKIVLGCRQTQKFTVTFNSDQGVGDFKSILLATPELSEDEKQLVAEDDDVLKPGALGNVSMNLWAWTIHPQLSVDKFLRVDGNHHVQIKYWSVKMEDAPSGIKKITYTNNTKADITFHLDVNGPFEIVKTKSNTGAIHPLALQQTPSKVVKNHVENKFCLQPLKIIEIHVKFITPDQSNREHWPQIMKVKHEGELTAYFHNGEKQILGLDGLLLRPKIDLLTEKPSKNDKAWDELNFGKVHVDKFRTIKVYLSNVTEVSARWSLNYVKFPKKKTIGHKTTTEWEEENLAKTDDPDVFEFSETEGILKGPSLALRLAPEGGMKPPVPKDEEQKQYLPLPILINFRPKADTLYKSKFRFTCENGISCDVILKGNGSYEENFD